MAQPVIRKGSKGDAVSRAQTNLNLRGYDVGNVDGIFGVLCIASDPSPTERIAGRSLVGNAGQRVQGLLAKLGLTRSYVCLNAWAYAVHPSRASAERDRLAEPAQLAWRNELYDAVTGARLQAIVGFGGMAQEAASLWSARPSVPLREVPHPSSRDETKLLDAWRARRSPSCDPSLRRIAAGTTAALTTATGSPRPTTRPSRGATCPSALPGSWATTGGSAQDPAALRTRSPAPRPTTVTR